MSNKTPILPHDQLMFRNSVPIFTTIPNEGEPR
ncbi:hypothetical protein AJ81_03935 [Pseudothermotoga hypogea DSM 11164 = NBRC 106472]|uniref:Uncharacterized protein n=1 Tax=Pseudothermotoga hypogea DSM 11164 = NBRC 106472 TaxID=1123384 RepID=A0A0X1KTX6_9THEM|nr:hypothetical protein AJ81_03935 [Pseudothermotoga hypogea DSM 11164 = NBRC 106472]